MQLPISHWAMAGLAAAILGILAPVLVAPSECASAVDMPCGTLHAPASPTSGAAVIPTSMTTPLRSSDDAPSGTTRRPGSLLVPCGKVSHADLHRAGYTCPRGHNHGHILTSPRGQVRWFDDEHVHVIDSCGARGADPHDEDDTPILWYVASAPEALSSTACPNNLPYAPPNGTPPPYGTGVPNPNIQIPRTWPSNPTYVINIPGGRPGRTSSQGRASRVPRIPTPSGRPTFRPSWRASPPSPR
jgi:hypothetical protein